VKLKYSNSSYHLVSPFFM